ncbi:MAG: hypothetical protein KBC94_07975 [Pseudacidovorax sp.]|uniref:hypothetical protein n=1 Tax=Pseudacidovorax sp. TaxID=1934311 RepID=UPI001B467CCF|nr:hypothetical protein [Pseudacidovorax sp.]MBP6894345.1 hypothetical protein [Pseudacidovorax sp.]
MSKTIDSPEKWNRAEERFIDERVFLFKKPDYVESVVWRKYMPSLAEVHAWGCARQAEKRTTKQVWTYEGAATANVGDIRDIRTQHGDSVEVVHDPSDGQGDHHAHLQLRFGTDEQHIPQRRTDLKEAVLRLFTAVDRHSCP